MITMYEIVDDENNVLGKGETVDIAVRNTISGIAGVSIADAIAFVYDGINDGDLMLHETKVYVN